MVFKGMLLAVLSAGTMFAGLAEGRDIEDICAMEIEGARLDMTQEAVLAIWSDRGLERHVPSRGGKRLPYLKFLLPQGQEREDFIARLQWNDFSQMPITNGGAFYVLELGFRPPQDKARLGVYNQMVTDKVRQWCGWAAPKIAVMDDNQRRRFERGCAAPVMMGADGVVRVSPAVRELPQTWDGCNWMVVGLNNGEFYMRLRGPKSPKGQ